MFYISLCVDFLVKMFKITVFFSGSFPQVLRVTEKDSISETAVWPIFILINAPVICVSGPLGTGDTEDIAVLKCRDLTADASRQCRRFARVLISR